MLDGGYQKEGILKLLNIFQWKQIGRRTKEDDNFGSIDRDDANGKSDNN